MQQQDVYERARLSRDARFDGQFFVGVKTTGIYCRPICPAVAPKSENVTFYASAAAAGEAGYRPCLRCRPECAPGTPAWNGTSTTVQRGLRLISKGALDEGSIEQLADRLGVTSRHLRRLFTKHLGASPLAVAHTQRLHFAKRLIDQTNLPMTHVATAAGYGSVRRFNDTFRRTYGRTPRELRRHSEDAFDSGTALAVRLTYSKPFDWQGMLDFFAGRATPGVESVHGNTYFRTVVVNDEPGVIECRHDSKRGNVTLLLHGIETSQMFQVVQRVREMLDLDAPVAEIKGHLGRDGTLGKLLRRNPGVRVPGAWDGFELTIRAILGQQVSVKAATTLAGRIAVRYGEKILLPASLSASPGELELGCLFPHPEKLARARLNDMGLVTSRADTIRRVARATAAGEIDFNNAQDPGEFCEQLQAIRGIGEWTAEYVVMRALKYPDAFPASDLGLLKAMGDEVAGTKELKQRAELWRPWRSYAALLLWGSLAGSGG
jgi:AraC family transcriptional regulator of adaptative response / DNA-3-methyladenine glycosylase II